MLSLDDIQDILRIKLIGVIPESRDGAASLQPGRAGRAHEGHATCREAYKDVVARFLGEDKPMRFVDAEKPGFFKRLFGGK